MNKWVILALAGILGTLARYAIAVGVPAMLGTGFPYGTLLVNLSACLLLGTLDGLAQTRALIGPEARLLWMTGFCGAYSTFSTWILESSYLLNDGEGLRALINLFGSVGLGLLLFRLGAYLGMLL